MVPGGNAVLENHSNEILKLYSHAKRSVTCGAPTRLRPFRAVGILARVSASQRQQLDRVSLVKKDKSSKKAALGLRHVLLCGWSFLVCSCLSPIEDGQDSSTGSEPDSPEESKEATQAPKGTSSTQQEEQGEASQTPQDASSKETRSSSQTSTEKPESTSSATTNTPTESSETTSESEEEPWECDEGQMRECLERPDGTKIPFPNGTVHGPYCKAGTKQCINNRWSSCLGAVEPKDKDTCSPGNDDNCNGVPNDHCKCTAGETQPCGTSVGACEKGTMTCRADGTWGECKGQIEPSREICDGRADEDCDGRADEDDPSCECINGKRTQCSMPGGRGDCSLGVRECTQGRWSACRARFPRISEACGQPRSDAIGRATGDEDCDGQVDESTRSAPPLGCDYYMLDADEDGWGRIGPSVHNVSDGYTYGCFCKVPGRNWKKYDPKDSIAKKRVNTDCGDCPDKKDEGWLVNPITKEYFAEASTCLEKTGWKGGAFDYNCNGKQDAEYPTFAPSCPDWATNNRSCSTNAYWMGSKTPPCGVKAVALNCKEGGNGIVPECIHDTIGATRLSSCN